MDGCKGTIQVWCWHQVLTSARGAGKQRWALQITGDTPRGVQKRLWRNWTLLVIYANKLQNLLHLQKTSLVSETQPRSLQQHLFHQKNDMKCSLLVSIQIEACKLKGSRLSLFCESQVSFAVKRKHQLKYWQQIILICNSDAKSHIFLNAWYCFLASKVS